MKKIMGSVSLVLLGGLAHAGLSAEEPGKALYLGQKYHCYSCHGTSGAGGSGPSFVGIGKKYDTEALMKRAAHNCPPTGACSPKELRALVEFIRKF